ncbi:Sterol-4-alpha-carboxylate 3-dehydrogenase, decarboxylating [Neolecta irregularis DAH-3]|uniref:Sterol-4-alpha-carboxylate 3-dehydrogenase, decarboxylating n=1 Tax=Neolecta irregularis (strain DAH-3) TaxID=1198029 RepID=A0A1U7LVC4_NEOID|nr:Sterol-4-alpha-carboxylate 3-dehydrogenase, decarboxylating [Neolecta irregularis DAH-3]|eukprot:OLL26523.1 Sterol-4-alpha-carboxylate 3-dehydrogenase, decarboxylating [Neolecta irregularis DAH-3]
MAKGNHQVFSIHWVKLISTHIATSALLSSGLSAPYSQTQFPPDQKMSCPLKSVLVIGGSGFLGSAIVAELVALNPAPKVAVFDLKIREDTKYPNVSYYTGDLLNSEDMRSAIKSSDATVILHTASPVHGLARDVYMKINVEGTGNIIEVSKEEGIQALVYTSSAGIVFDGDDLINVNESAPFPKIHMDGYNESKAEAEKLILQADDRKGMRTCALRPAGIFGPRDRQCIPGMLTVYYSNQTKFQIGDNLNLFDFTYVGNAVHAHILAAEKLLDSQTVDKVAGEAFFITNGEPIYFWDFPLAVWAHLGHCPPYIIRFPRIVGIGLAAMVEALSYFRGKEAGFTRFRVKFACASRYYNISKARDILGYKPLVSLDEGIKRTLKWIDEEQTIQAQKKVQ